MEKYNEYIKLETDLRKSQGTDTMTSLQTDQTLIDRLKLAASVELTAEELQKQRISFILGSLKDDSTVTRSRIREVLAEREGKKSAA